MAHGTLCHLRSRFGRATLRALSGALVDLEFDVAGRVVRPLASAPWGVLPPMADPQPAAHLMALGGEWPCVPFGRSSADPVKHGHGTDADWHLVTAGSAQATLAIDYPTGHAVRRLERTVALSDDAPRVELSLTIHAARAATIPVGLHPILAFPDHGTLRLTPAAHGTIRTAPASLAPANATLAPDQPIGPDGIARLRDGSTTCLWDQPGRQGEDLILVQNCPGGVEADDGTTLTRLTWDAGALPHLLIWIANPGLGQEPRLKGFRGLGLEPVAAHFDATPEGEGLPLSPDRPTTIRYAIDCQPSRAKEPRP